MIPGEVEWDFVGIALEIFDEITSPSRLNANDVIYTCWRKRPVRLRLTFHGATSAHLTTPDPLHHYVTNYTGLI